MSVIEDEIFMNKRISLKVLNCRSKPAKSWNAADMKKAAFAQLSGKG
jgi:hypothetical protein